VLFDDGTSLPLTAIPDRDYTLLAETLNKDVVMLAPPHRSRLVTITAVSRGSGDLIRVSLGIGSGCPVTKSLVTGFALVNVDFDEMLQSDAGYYHHHQRDHERFDPYLYSGPFLVSRDRVVYSHLDRSRKGRRRKGKGRAASDRGKTPANGRVSPTDSVDVFVPHVEAQQQRQEPVIEAPRKTLSSLELAMYILLAVFSLSVVVFAANCMLFVVRRGRNKKLAEPKDQVLEVTISLSYMCFSLKLRL